MNHDRNVTYDRYLSDLNLPKALLERKMTSLGVVNHKHAFVPNELKTIRKQLYSSSGYISMDRIQSCLSQLKRRDHRLSFYQYPMIILMY